MRYDIFLSHSSLDRTRVEEASDELKGIGYRVFLDFDALPAVKPDEVTAATANALRDAMRRCTSLLYLISAHATHSRWMPWELGFFDGVCGRVFIYPLDGRAAAHARGQEFLRIYPIVPLRGRAAFLSKHVPMRDAGPRSASAAASPLAGDSVAQPAAARAPLFDYAPQQMTELNGQRLSEVGQRAPFDPAEAMRTGRELAEAWWRLWGLMPAAKRPGEKDGEWGD